MITVDDDDDADDGLKTHSSNNLDMFCCFLSSVPTDHVRLANLFIMNFVSVIN